MAECRWFGAIVACSLAVLVSFEARATVAPRCRPPSAKAAPLPIDAGKLAVLFSPDPGATTYQVDWLDPSGAAVAYDQAEVDGSLYLRPRAAVVAGHHTLVYTDDCEDPPGPPTRLDLDFEVAPPPVKLGTLSVRFDAYCPNDPSFKIAPDWPPPVAVSLTLDPDLMPYAPLLEVRLRDDSGRLDATFLAGASNSNVLVAMPYLDCSGVSPSVPPGTRTFVAEGQLLDGPALGPVTATADLECPSCPFDAGVPVAPGAEPTGNLSHWNQSSGCTVESTSTRRDPADAVLASLAVLLFGVRRRSTPRGRVRWP